MGATEIIAAILAGINLIERLLPMVDGLVATGEIDVETQKTVRAKLDSLRTKADGQFQGAHWKLD